MKLDAAAAASLMPIANVVHSVCDALAVIVRVPVDPDAATASYAAPNEPSTVDA